MRYSGVARLAPFSRSLGFREKSSSTRVSRSLYSRAVGYNFEAVKIFMPANREKPVYAKYIEHVPPDVTAAIFWSKNRDPQHWRDSQQLEHVLGKYIISDQPMTEEQWAKERATVIDVTPDDEASHRLPMTARGLVRGVPILLTIPSAACCLLAMSSATKPSRLPLSRVTQRKTKRPRRRRNPFVASD
jgi:hypothetical protein